MSKPKKVRPLRRVLAAAEEAAALALFAGIHWCIDHLAELLFHDFGRGLLFLRVVFFGCFAVVYVHQAVEMVVALAPGSRRLAQRFFRWAGHTVFTALTRFADRKRR